MHKIYILDQFHLAGVEWIEQRADVVRWDDPTIGIDWQIADPKVSPRDAAAPLLSEIDRLPRYEG